MTKTHCDNCDTVLSVIPKAEALRSVLRDGTLIQVETIIFHPLTLKRLELCAACARDIINTATQPYMAPLDA